ncbi:hypothetical protein PF003_g38127 [Phytophthora fragariae]|nr:hypothetical protein PF003_g38127 [Phytophthora fragariae]
MPRSLSRACPPGHPPPGLIRVPLLDPATRLLRLPGPRSSIRHLQQASWVLTQRRPRLSGLRRRKYRAILRISRPQLLSRASIPFVANSRAFDIVGNSRGVGRACGCRSSGRRIRSGCDRASHANIDGVRPPVLPSRRAGRQRRSCTPARVDPVLDRRLEHATTLEEVATAAVAPRRLPVAESEMISLRQEVDRLQALAKDTEDKLHVEMDLRLKSDIFCVQTSTELHQAQDRIDELRAERLKCGIAKHRNRQMWVLTTNHQMWVLTTNQQQ